MLFQFAAHQLLADVLPLMGNLRCIGAFFRHSRLAAQEIIQAQASVAGLLGRMHQQRHQAVFCNDLGTGLNALDVLLFHHADGILH